MGSLFLEKNGSAHLLYRFTLDGLRLNSTIADSSSQSELASFAFVIIYYHLVDSCLRTFLCTVPIFLDIFYHLPCFPSTPLFSPTPLSFLPLSLFLHPFPTSLTPPLHSGHPIFPKPASAPFIPISTISFSNSLGNPAHKPQHSSQNLWLQGFFVTESRACRDRLGIWVRNGVRGLGRWIFVREEGICFVVCGDGEVDGNGNGWVDGEMTYC